LLDVPDPELAARRAAWRPRPPYATRGVLAKYAELVSSASLGAVTDRVGATAREPAAGNRTDARAVKMLEGSEA